MKNLKKMGWRVAALTALIGLAGKAGATTGTSSYLNIDVTFNAGLSVSVDSVGSSTYTTNWTLTPNQQLLSATTATVTNDTGIISEHWKLFTNPNSLATSGSVWTAATSSTSVGADQFAIQAVFGSSNTASGGCASATTAGTWNLSANAPVLTTTLATALTYTSAGQLASTELVNGGTSLPDAAGNVVYGNSKRALCWRIIAPASTVATQTQNVQVVVAAF